MIGVVTRTELFKRFEETDGVALETRLSEIALADPVAAFADEPLRVVVERMAETGFTRLPVLDPQSERRLVGMISLNDLLHARTQSLTEERERQRALRIHTPFPRGIKSSNSPSAERPDHSKQL